MSTYAFEDRWRVRARLGEVMDVMGDATDLPRWWPSTYLGVRELERGDATGVGKLVELHAKGWLPYTLTFQLRVVEYRYPHGITAVASGDFDGTSVWHARQDGLDACLTHVWTLRVEKPLVRLLTPLVRPIFALNHHWAMRRGEQSLELELARRRGAAVPSPPGPTFGWLVRPAL